MIDTILLVPADGDPHGLLADGVCGARPPTLTWCYNTTTDVDGWARPGPGMRPHEGVHAARALVLAYQGKPVAEGCDRAIRALRARTGGMMGAVHDDYDIGFVLRAVPRLVEQLGARLVLLAADGREVTP